MKPYLALIGIVAVLLASGCISGETINQPSGGSGGAEPGKTLDFDSLVSSAEMKIEGNYPSIQITPFSESQMEQSGFSKFASLTWDNSLIVSIGESNDGSNIQENARNLVMMFASGWICEYGEECNPTYNLPPSHDETILGTIVRVYSNENGMIFSWYKDIFVFMCFQASQEKDYCTQVAENIILEW